MSNLSFCTFGDLVENDTFISGKDRFKKIGETPYEDDKYNAEDLNGSAFWFFEDTDAVIKF